MSVNSLDSATSGLYANAARLAVSGHNVANINTNGFQSQEINTTDSAYINDIGTGTRVSAVYSPPRPGPMVQDTTGAESGENGGTPGMVELSNTDLVRETTNQIAARNAYSVNLSTIRSTDEMTETLLDMVR